MLRSFSAVARTLDRLWFTSNYEKWAASRMDRGAELSQSQRLKSHLDSFGKRQIEVREAK
jgi:hypothetical protein